MPRYNGNTGNKTIAQSHRCTACHQPISCRDRRRARCIGLRADQHIGCSIVVVLAS